MNFLNKTTLGFDWYDEDPKDKNLIALSDEYHAELLEARNNGKVLSVLRNKIVLKDFVIPASDLPDLERQWRNTELARADISLLKSEDGDGVGLPSDWRKYRVALRAWPDHAKFPDNKHRPIAPDTI